MPCTRCPQTVSDCRSRLDFARCAKAACNADARRYPAAVVAPFALLTPCTGVVASIFGEVFSPARYAGMALILCGLTIIALPLQRMKALIPARRWR